MEHARISIAIYATNYRKLLKKTTPTIFLILIHADGYSLMLEHKEFDSKFNNYVLGVWQQYKKRSENFR